LTDTSEPVRKLLRYRAYDLYRWVPAGHEPPPEPVGYVDLQWAPTLPPVSDVAAAITAAMERRPLDRTVQIAREVGWLFGGMAAGGTEGIPSGESA